MKITAILGAAAFSLPSVAMAQAAKTPWSDAIEIEARRPTLSYSLAARTLWDDKEPRPFHSLFEGRSATVKWEAAYLALSAIDAAQTISCLKRDICEEGNPLFGKHPSTTTIIAAKAASGLLHVVLLSELEKRDPKMALKAAQISAGMQGGVVAMNARIAF